LSGFSLTSDLQLLLGIGLTLCLKLRILTINLILELLAALLHVFLKSGYLSSVGLVTAFTFFLEELADLGELIRVASVDRFDLVEIGLLALCV
jgi:hypothetical protein